MKKYSIILICLIGISLQAQWTQEKGKGYYKIGAWWLEADEHYTSTGLVDPNATRGLFITNFAPERSSTKSKVDPYKYG